MDDDAALNRILITLGAEEVKLKNLADGKVFTAIAAQGHARTCSNDSRSSATPSGATAATSRNISRERDPKTAHFPLTWSRSARETPNGSPTSRARPKCERSTRRIATSTSSRIELDDGNIRGARPTVTSEQAEKLRKKGAACAAARASSNCTNRTPCKSSSPSSREEGTQDRALCRQRSSDLRADRRRRRESDHAPALLRFRRSSRR